MALTLAEAAQAKKLTRNGMWLAIKRGAVNARMTSGGMWLIEEDDKWEAFRPRRFPGKRDYSAEEGQGGA